MATIDITGRRHGMMTVVGLHHIHVTSGGQKQGRWTVKCDCGQTRIIPLCALRRYFSCGCNRNNNISKNKSKHGWARRGKNLRPEYRIWSLIHQRCNNPKNPAYIRYGGRGIKVCEQWRTFEGFIKDMGERPEGKSVDRIDTNGDYCPENCRWATILEQANNRRGNKNISVNGRTMTASEWERETGVNHTTIKWRLKRGVPASEAVSDKTNRCARMVTIGGVTKNVSQWARESGTQRATIALRLKKGWDAKEAVFAPLKKNQFI